MPAPTTDNDNAPKNNEAYNKKICRRYGWYFIATASILLVVYLFTPSGTIGGGEIDVRLGHWTIIDVDPTKRWIEVNPKDPGAVSWQVVVNEDFDHPLFSTPDQPLQSLGEGVKTLHLALVGRHGPKSHPFIVVQAP